MLIHAYAISLAEGNLSTAWSMAMIVRMLSQIRITLIIGCGTGEGEPGDDAYLNHNLLGDLKNLLRVCTILCHIPRLGATGLSTCNRL